MICTYRRSRGWFIRRPKPQVKPRTKSSGNCQWRYGLGYLGCKKTASKTTTAPRKVSTPASACITQLKNEYRAPSVIIRIFLKKPQICKKLLSAIRDAFLESTSFRQPSIPQEVKRKYVKKLVTVERPLNTKKKGKYGKDVITFLNNRGIKTSISRNPTTITHSGVLVTTEDGKTYLIHKTKKDKTRVEYRPNLLDDPDWKAVKTIKPKKRLTINDYFNSTEPKKYFFWTNNCHHATERMVQLAS